MAYPTDVILGPNRHVTMWPEDPDEDSSSEATWGTKPGTPRYYHMPLDTYDVRLTRDHRNNTPYLGQKARKHGRAYRGMPSGSFGGKLHGYWPSGATRSLAQFLMDMAFGLPDSNFINSFGAEDAQGPDTANKQHNGLRINRFTLSGSDQSGVVEFTADVMGKSEATVGTAQTVPNDLEKLLDFEFPDATMELDLAGGTSYTEHEIESFQLVRDNMLRPKYLNSREPTALASGGRETTLQLSIPKHANTWDGYARTLTADTFISGRLTLLGLHNGSAANNYTKVVIVFPRLRFVDPSDRHNVNDYSMTTLDFQCLKPDSASAEISLTWSTQA